MILCLNLLTMRDALFMSILIITDDASILFIDIRRDIFMFLKIVSVLVVLSHFY